MKFLLATFFLSIFTFLNAQTFKIKNNNLLRYLINNQTSDISTHHENLISKFFNINDSKQINNFPQKLVKNNGKLLITIERTGRLYEFKQVSYDSVQITRIDSTYFYGYNGNAILLSVNDTLFSFGGNGFWRTNGHLRYFSEKNHEWDIIKTNIEIPTSNILYFHDKQEKNLYFTLLPFTDPSTGKKNEEGIFYKLNLNDKHIVELGKIPKRFLQLLKEVRNVDYNFISLENPKGLFVSFDINNQFLFLFEKNQVYKVQNPTIIDYFYGSSKNFVPTFSFSRNNYLYSTRMYDTTFNIDSVKIEMKDFVKESYPLYENTDEENYFIWGSSTALILLVSIGSFLYIKKKNKKIQVTPSEQLKVETNETEGLRFNPIELNLIEKMTEPKRGKIQFSVEEINVLLGLGKKSLEIQKKIRTETLNRINHKFRVIYETEGELIQRARSEDDRRFYKYFISEENAKRLKL